MAKNWLDPAEITRDSRIYGAFLLVLCGIAAWDVLSTLWFDFAIVTGRRPWRWPMLLYFVCRICLLLHVFSLAVNLNAIAEIPCQQVVWISKIADAVGTCGSSLILVLRTGAVWRRDIKVMVLLSLLFLGQIAIWAQTFRFSRSKWNPQRNACAVISTAPKSILITVFAYTMAFDLVILILCAFQLSTARRSSTIAYVLWRDGIGYFCAAFGANFVQMVFASLGLNPVMNIIALPFALVVSVIASTTVFRNVFVAYDAFSSRGSDGNSSTGGHYSGPQILNSGRFTHGGLPSHRMDIPLSQYKTATSDATGGISVHRVVELTVDRTQHTKSQGVESVHSLSGEKDI